MADTIHTVDNSGVSTGPVSACRSSIKERLDFKEVSKIVFVFLVWFMVGLLYISYSDLISTWLAITFSLIFGLLFSAGYASSCHFRCAMAVFIVQCFSRFGLFMMFIQCSWLTAMAMLEKVVIFHKSVNSAECADEVRTLVHNDGVLNYPLMERILKVLHFTALIPVLSILLYSFLYELTYKERQSSKNGSKHTADKDSLVNVFVQFIKHFMSFIVGLVLSSTITIAFTDSLIYSIVAVLIHNEACRKVLMPDSDLGMLIFYLIFCLLLFVLLPFSDYILKLRGVIIRQFFSNGDPMLAKESNVRFIKGKINNVEAKVHDGQGYEAQQMHDDARITPPASPVRSYRAASISGSNYWGQN